MKPIDAFLAVCDERGPMLDTMSRSVDHCRRLFRAHSTLHPEKGGEIWHVTIEPAGAVEHIASELERTRIVDPEPAKQPQETAP